MIKLLCPLTYSFLLSDEFCTKKAIVLSILLPKKQRRGGENIERASQVTDHSALLRQNARALVNQVVFYIPLIL
jgi:hypothetical protein